MIPVRRLLKVWIDLEGQLAARTQEEIICIRTRQRPLNRVVLWIGRRVVRHRTAAGLGGDDLGKLRYLGRAFQHEGAYPVAGTYGVDCPHLKGVVRTSDQPIYHLASGSGTPHLHRYLIPPSPVGALPVLVAGWGWLGTRVGRGRRTPPQRRLPIAHYRRHIGRWARRGHMDVHRYHIGGTIVGYVGKR